MTDYQAELLTAIMSSTSRRNVLGAIAFCKERLQLPAATTTETNREEQTEITTRRIRRACPQTKIVSPFAHRYLCAETRGKTVFSLTDSFRKGPQHLRAHCNAPIYSGPQRPMLVEVSPM